jgi:hypothetical protein
LVAHKSALDQTRTGLYANWSELSGRERHRAGILNICLCNIHILVPIGNDVYSSHSVDALQSLRNTPVGKLPHKVVKLSQGYLEIDFAVISVEVVLY